MTCMACGLKHSLRADGLCPRCGLRNPSTPDGGGTDAAWPQSDSGPQQNPAPASNFSYGHTDPIYKPVDFQPADFSAADPASYASPYGQSADPSSLGGAPDATSDLVQDLNYGPPSTPPAQGYGHGQATSPYPQAPSHGQHPSGYDQQSANYGQQSPTYGQADAHGYGQSPTFGHAPAPGYSSSPPQGYVQNYDHGQGYDSGYDQHQAGQAYGSDDFDTHEPQVSAYERVAYHGAGLRQAYVRPTVAGSAAGPKAFNWMSNYGPSDPTDAQSSWGEIGAGLGFGLLTAAVCGAGWAGIAYVSGYELGILAAGVGWLTGLAVAMSGCRLETSRLIALVCVVAGLLFGKVLIIEWEIPFKAASKELARDDRTMYLFTLYDMAVHEEVPRSVRDTIMGMQFWSSKPKTYAVNPLVEQYEERIARKLRSYSVPKREQVAQLFLRDTMRQVSYPGRLSASLSWFDLLWFFLALTAAYRAAGQEEED